MRSLVVICDNFGDIVKELAVVERQLAFTIKVIRYLLQLFTRALFVNRAAI